MQCIDPIVRRAIGIAFSLCLMAVACSAEVITLNEGSTTGYVLTNGNTYVVSKSMSFPNSEATESGITVANNATVVLYVPKGVSLRATGANARQSLRGGAGIEVPASSTLIITGEGSVSATGGNSASGTKGENGGDGTAWAYWSPTDQPVVGGTGGTGGAGGSGGGGAGAGIGGSGGRTMGTVYVLGSVRVMACSGASGGGGVSFGKTGTKGKSASATLSPLTKPGFVPNYTQSYGGGGGGGGGGAPGSLPDCAIGGGGGNGGRGGNGTSGYGGPVGIYHDPYDGDNGATGTFGENGGAGTFYVAATASVNVNRTMSSATTHPALNHTLSFDANGGTFTSSARTVTATLCAVLPDCIPAPSWPGCSFLGWFTEPFGGTIWYGPDGSKKVSSYADPTVTTLYAHWKLPVLRVESQWGETYPDKGVSEYEPGTVIDAWLTLPPERDGVRLEFKGWTGTGSVPASGTDTDVSFTIGEDSSLTWNWECKNRISVSVPVDGQCNFGTQWVEHGRTVQAMVLPPDGYCETVLLGDTNGVTVSGNILSVPSDGPRNLSVRIYGWNHLVGAIAWNGSSASNGWKVVEDVTATDGYSLRSTPTETGLSSTNSATVNGSGRIAFDWRISANRGDYARVYVDGVQQAQITRKPEWSTVSISVEGDGDHVVSWVYDRKSSAAANDNAAYIDNVSWIHAASATSSTPVPVPYAWFDLNYPTILAAHGSDYEAAANATAANGVNKVWECYVADIDPSDPEARLIARFAITEGKMTVVPDPNRGDARVYRILGTKSLDAGATWDDVTELEDFDAAGYRFFKVSAALPEVND